jgi:hypothetical protein
MHQSYNIKFKILDVNHTCIHNEFVHTFNSIFEIKSLMLSHEDLLLKIR